MSGRLVISLDFELMWGVRDSRTVADYGDAIMGGRAAIPHLLKTFSDQGIRATWATVGLLFARNRDEIHDFLPAERPRYQNANLSPYPALDQIGQCETDDPLHYGHSLVTRIAQTEGQEIATHTFGHIYALEAGMSDAAWRADLQSALDIGQHHGHRLRSIVFPRNQMGPSHVRICHQMGLTVYRGVSDGHVYRSRAARDLSLMVRATRFLDGAFPVVGTQSFDAPTLENGCVNVPASRFLRPWSARLPLYSRLHQRRVIQEMERAARTGRHYHLWWHPHNMGRNFAQNMAQLGAILTAYRRLHDQYGFQSVTMSELAQQRNGAC